MPALRAALGDDEPNIRLCAVMALSAMGTEAAAAAPELLRAQQDPDARVRALAEHAYRTATGDVSDKQRALRQMLDAERSAR